MRTQLSIMLAVGTLMVGAPVAMAANPQSSGSDTLSLTKSQRAIVWNDLQRQATEQKMPFSFKPTVGSAMPSTIMINPVPSKAASDIPSLRPYDFAMVQGKLLIVNPSDKKVAAVVAETAGS